MSSNVISLSDVIRSLHQNGGTDEVVFSFETEAKDTTLADLMLLALDFHYDGDEDEFLEDMSTVMNAADEKKLVAVSAWLEQLLEPLADEIEAAQVACG